MILGSPKTEKLLKNLAYGWRCCLYNLTVQDYLTLESSKSNKREVKHLRKN